jgi:hypothetical protein
MSTSISGSIPAQPGLISGLTLVYPTATQIYSVTAVSGATSYVWIIPSGWTGTSTSNSITVTVGSNSGTISVAAKNNCGTGVARSLALTIGSVLPVTLTQFNGNLIGGVVELTWQTSNEINLKSFVVEKSLDGNNFNSIGEVSAKGSNGSSVNYNFYDRDAPSDVSFYRLKLVDNDGHFSYSTIVKITGSKEKMNTRFYPNPTTTDLNIEIYSNNKKKISIDLFDFSGRMIMHKIADLREGINQQKLFLAPLASGTYFIELRDSQSLILGKSRVVKLN